MRIDLLADSHYAKRDLRRCLSAAHRTLRDRGWDLPKVFELEIKTRPRIRRMRSQILRFSNLRELPPSARITLPRKGLHQEQVAQYMLLVLSHVLSTGQRRLHGIDYKALRRPLEPYQKPKRPPLMLDERYEKALAQLGQAEARVVALQKKLARAEKHRDKKKAEVRRRARELTRPVEAGHKLSDTQLAARLRVKRKDEPLPPPPS